jgi:hypothetical protein
VKKFLIIAFSILAIFGALGAIDATAAAYPPGLGGTGTTASPTSGQTLIGNASGTYTPANVSSGAGVSITNGSGTITIGNTGVTSLAGSGCVSVPDATGSISLAVSCISGNQNIVFTITGDATGTASGTTAITDTITVIGLNGKLLPTNTTGTLQYSGGAWSINLATSSLGLYNANGVLSSYAGSSCGGSQYVSSISATGVVTCSVPPGTGVSTFNNSSGTVNYADVGTGNVTTTKAVSGGNTTTTFSITGVIPAANGGTATTTALGSNAFTSTPIPTTFVSMLNGGSGAVTYNVNAGTGIAVTTSTTSSTVTLNINNGSVQNCATGQLVNGLSATGTIACTVTINSIGGVSTGTILLSGTGGIRISTTTNTITISGVSTSTANTWTAPQTFSGGVAGPLNVASDTISGSIASPSLIENLDTVIYASTSTPSGFGDYAAYLTSLCLANATGTTIMVPQGVLNVSTTILEAYRCTYQGAGGGGTILNWTGPQGGAMAQMAFPPTPHTAGGGFYNITFSNAQGSATTTNPTIGILEGSSTTAGGAHSIVYGNTFVGLGLAMEVTSGTYDNTIQQNTFRNNGGAIWTLPSNNSGEAEHIVLNWVVDQAGGSGNNCIWFQTSSVEQADVTDNTNDNCQIRVGANNQVFINSDEVENAGYLDGNYIPIQEDSSGGSNMVVSGLQVTNDSSSTASTYASVFYIGSNAVVSGVTVNRNTVSNATSVPILVQDDGSAGNENLTISDVYNESGGFQQWSTSAANNLPTSTPFSGWVQQYHNSYWSGWVQQGNNRTQLYNGDGTTISISTGPAGGGSAAGMTSEFGGLNNVGTSTISDDGTLGLRTEVNAASVPITGPEAGTNGYANYIFTGSSAATDTLPLIASSTFREYTFYDRGTAAFVVNASSSDLINNAAATSTAFSLASGHGVTFVDDGTYWDVIMKD